MTRSFAALAVAASVLNPYLKPNNVKFSKSPKERGNYTYALWLTFQVEFAHMYKAYPAEVPPIIRT